MRILLLPLAATLLLQSIVWAQPDPISELFAQGQFEKVRQEAPIRLDEARRIGAPSADRAALWLILGMAEFQLDQYDQALRALDEGIKLSEPVSASMAEIAVSLHATRGEVLSVQDKYPEAAQAFRKALSEAEAHLPTGHLRLAQVYTGLGALAFAQGNYARAESLRRQALSIAEKNQAPLAARAIAASSLATVLVVQHRPLEAKALLEWSAKVLSDTYGPAHPEAILARYTLGMSLVDSAPAESERVLRQALAVWLASQPEQHIVTANILQALATARRLQGDVEDAVRLSARAAEILRRSLGPESRVVVLQMAEHARLLRAAKRSKEGEALEKQARRIRLEKGYPEPGKTVDARALRPRR